MQPLNLFYKEPDPDRWIKFDRYPRRAFRTLFRGRKRPGGQQMVALNLMKGLDKIGVPYRLNDFNYIKKHPKELACIVGKHFLLDDFSWKNPILFGAAVFSHPLEYPNLFERHPNILRMLVPGPWMEEMLRPYYSDRVMAWPVGIDTGLWSTAIKQTPTTDFLIYDKILFDHDNYEIELINPIREYLTRQGFTYEVIKYGSYMPKDLVEMVSRAKACIFLSCSETQGLAYQQILATGTPLMAWDEGQYWKDPNFFPEKVKFKPISSVPYWDSSLCGEKFADIVQFSERFPQFVSKLNAGQYAPRTFILNSLTLEKCAHQYVAIAEALIKEKT